MADMNQPLMNSKTNTAYPNIILDELDLNLNINQNLIFNQLNKKYGLPNLFNKVPQSSMFIITPELGELLLSLNKDNRPIRKKALKAMIEEMTRGNFYTTGQGITIDWNGKMIDGQHRLFALKSCGWPQILIPIATGINPDAKLYLDQHSKRHFKDCTNINLPNSKKITNKFGSIVKYIIQYNNNWNKAIPIPSEIEAVGSSLINEITEIVGIPCEKGFFATSYYAGFVKIAYETKNLIKVKEFVTKVVDGPYPSTKMPSWLLYKYVGDTKGGSGSSLHEERMSRAIRATNAYLKGLEVNSLRAEYLETLHLT
jgi:hypothetical protein